MLNTANDLVVKVEAIRPEDIRAYDIAWALHHINRFGGHSPVPWDVLSHTGLAYMLYVQDVKGQTEVPFSLALLLHDAAEAYVGDMVWPLKHTVMADQFRQLEAHVLDVIYQRFNVPQEPLGPIDWDKVARYDKQAAAIEFHQLFPKLRGTQYAPPLVYDMSKYPVLIKGKVEDYITLLKHISINHGVEDVSALFSLSDSLRPYLTAEIEEAEATAEQGTVDIDIRETRSVEDLRV
jgi:hypothetical protein